jgi:hypothetical protein
VTVKTLPTRGGQTTPLGLGGIVAKCGESLHEADYSANQHALLPLDEGRNLID